MVIAEFKGEFKETMKARCSQANGLGREKGEEKGDILLYRLHL